MTTNLSDAARLYLKDIEVLEEARSELNEYLGTIWTAINDTVSISKKAFEHDGRSWSGYADSSGRCLYFNAPGVVFSLGVCDPFMGEQGAVFAVWLSCTRKTKDKIKADGWKHVVDAAKERQLQIDFSDVDSLCQTTIPVDVDSPAVAETIGKRLLSFAEHAVALQAVVQGLPHWVQD